MKMAIFNIIISWPNSKVNTITIKLSKIENLLSKNFFTIFCTPMLSNPFTFLAVVCVSIGIVIYLLRALYKSKLN